MLELILSRENMLIALKRVERNKGSHGVDHMSVKSLREHIAENWQTIKHQIIKGAYMTAPVITVEITTLNGGKMRYGYPIDNVRCNYLATVSIVPLINE